MNKRNKSKIELAETFGELPMYRIGKLSQFDYGVRVFCYGKTHDDIAYIADWIYIVNLVAAVADTEPLWRLMIMDNLDYGQVAKLAADLRASDMEPTTVCKIVYHAFNGLDPFSDFPFAVKTRVAAISDSMAHTDVATRGRDGCSG